VSEKTRLGRKMRLYWSKQRTKEQTSSLSQRKNYEEISSISSREGHRSHLVTAWLYRKKIERLSGHYEPCQQVDIIHTREWRGGAKRETQEESEESRFQYVW